MIKLKDRLAEAMKVRGKIAAEVAVAVKKTESTVSQWLDGKVKSMRSDSLMAVCRFLYCNPEWLASNKGESGLNRPMPGGAIELLQTLVVDIPQTQTLESHLRGLSGYLTQLSPKGRVHAKSALAALVDDPEDVDGVAATIRAQIGLANEAEETSRQQKFISSTNVG